MTQVYGLYLDNFLNDHEHDLAEQLGFTFYRKRSKKETWINRFQRAPRTHIIYLNTLEDFVAFEKLYGPLLVCESYITIFYKEEMD